MSFRGGGEMIRKTMLYVIMSFTIASIITFHANANPIENDSISNITNSPYMTNDISDADNSGALTILEQKNNIEKQIEIQDNKIESNTTALNNYNEKSKKLNSDISQSVQSIDNISKNINNLNAISNERIKAMYINISNQSYINFILTSKNLSELASNIYTVRNIINWDRKNIEDLKANKTMLQNKINQLNSDKLELDKLTKKISDETNVLKSQKESEEKLISNLNEIISQNENLDPSTIDASTINTQNSIVNYSLSFLGVPYVWGGTTPNGFDCSGFVQYVYGHFGINIPRVSQDQQNFGTKIISKTDLQPGDLIFWGNPAYHVGMYIGNGKYIEAPHTGDVVKIATLYDYTSAQRIQ